MVWKDLSFTYRMVERHLPRKEFLMADQSWKLYLQEFEMGLFPSTLLLVGIIQVTYPLRPST